MSYEQRWRNLRALDAYFAQAKAEGLEREKEEQEKKEKEEKLVSILESAIKCIETNTTEIQELTHRVRDLEKKVNTLRRWT